MKLKSASSVRGRVARNCTQCGIIVQRPWVYNLSSKKPVYLCSECKPLVLSKSFGKNAHLKRMMISSGFETNRRKH